VIELGADAAESRSLIPNPRSRTITITDHGSPDPTLDFPADFESNALSTRPNF
jgi:hypothetical protein